MISAYVGVLAEKLKTIRLFCNDNTSSPRFKSGIIRDVEVVRLTK